MKQETTQQTACDLCGSLNSEMVSSRRLLGRDLSWCRCLDCSLVYQTIKGEERLGDEFFDESAYFDDANIGYTGYLSAAAERCRKVQSARWIKLIEKTCGLEGRTLEIGCGTGTNAIYLASKGFTVTGVEVAPTALVLAERKARKAKVRVRWLVADVTAMGEMEPFDFIFDRGCYHHVQLYNSTGFVKTVDRLTRSGAHFLLLAGNANQPRHGGPPRVEETKLVNDFAKTWDFVCLREIRFESRNPNHKTGPWAWSALMRRRAPKK